MAGNVIGLGAPGTRTTGGSLANSTGILIDGFAQDNTIGGTSSSAANVIAGNTTDGVEIDGSYATGNQILSDSIFDTVNLTGIALTDRGNDNEPAPTVSSVTSQGFGTTITGTTSASSPTVQVFANPSCADPEGRTLLGTATVTRTGFTLTVNRLPTADGITATQTDGSTHDTSPFSACVTAAGGTTG